MLEDMTAANKISSILSVHACPMGTICGSLSGSQRRVKSSTDNLGSDREADRARARDRIAQLLVPLEIARQREGQIVWHVVWQR